MVFTKKRVGSDVLEKIIVFIMILLGVAAIWIMINALTTPGLIASDLAILETLIVILVAILAQTIVMIRVYEMQIVKKK
jgi:ABC-type antimicrobial peptide transport system permease subunit